MHVDIKQATTYLRSRGWLAVFSAADETADASSGGVAVIWKSWVTVSGWQDVHSRLAFADFVLKGVVVRFASWYGLCYGDDVGSD